MMKNLGNLASEMIAQEQNGKFVSFQCVLGGWRALPEPVLSTDLCCAICGGLGHIAPFADEKQDDRRIWICLKIDCESNKRRSHGKSTSISDESKREIPWPEFCEKNCIGDLHYDVRYEKINQSPEVMRQIADFVLNTEKIILMQGTPGTGKTYAALGICEKITRKTTSCIFTTQRKMYEDSLKLFTLNEPVSYKYKCEVVQLLVVDDFGTSEITPGFFSFFMDVINSRIQWRNRGTIISTNLPDVKLLEYCGEALFDRLKQSKKFVFKGSSRRIPNKGKL